MLQQRNPAPLIMPLPLLCALLGLAFCAWYAWGNSIELCLTAGCEVSSDMTIGGVSLWWYGCTAFALLTIASFSGRPGLGVFVSGMCLLADILLLLVMLTTAPCSSCLVVALLFALTFLSFRYADTSQEKRSRSYLWYFWLILFVINAGAVVRESFDPWSIQAPTSGESTVNLYFSPSCPSCADAVKAFEGNAQVAYYPVTENENDALLIAHMLSHMEKGKSLVQALNEVRGTTVTGQSPLNIFTEISLQFNLMKNKGHVLASGSSVIPFIEYKGLPAFLVPKKPTPKPTAVVQEQSTPASISVPPVAPPVSSQTGAEASLGIAPTKEDTKENGEFLPEHVPTSMEIYNNNDDATLPVDTSIAGSCGGLTTEPCPD